MLLNQVKFSLNSEQKVKLNLHSTWRWREQTWSFELLKDGWNQPVKRPMTHAFKNSYEHTNAAMDPEL